MKEHKIRWVYLKERLIPPRFRQLSFRELMQLYRRYERVKLVYIDPKFYLVSRLLQGICALFNRFFVATRMEKLVTLGFIDRIVNHVQLFLLKKSKSIVVVV